MLRSKITRFCLLFILSAGFLISSCSKEAGPQGPAGANATPLEGSIVGYVFLYDQYGSKILVNDDSVQVTLSGVNDVAYTDPTGRYEFDNVIAGVYSATYSKLGYGSEVVTSFQFTGGSILYRGDIHLSAIPNFSVSGMRDSIGTYNVYVTDSIATADTKARSVIIYVGSSSGVSYAPSSYLSFYTKTVNANSRSTVTTIPLSDLSNLGFTPGQTVYFASYGIATNFSNSSEYEDYTTGRTIYTAISVVVDTSSIVFP